jgi:hypothetical protein
MVTIGTEVFTLVNLIIELPKEILSENDIFLKYCEYSSAGEMFVMSFKDIVSNDIYPYIDWFRMSFEEFKNFKLDQMKEKIIFYSIHNLMYGLQEFYSYIESEFNLDIRIVKQNLIKCLNTINNNIETEDVISNLDTLSI